MRTVQIGIGHDHADATYTSMCTLNDRYDVVGLVPFEENMADRLKWDAYKGANILKLDDVLTRDDIDAVAIETEERSATEVAKMFAERGISVHLDKPGSQNERAFSEMISAFDKSGADLQMGYMYRFNPLIRKIITDAQAGALGQVYSVEAQMSVRHPDDKRAWLGQFKGGMMFFLGCHLIDIVLQLKGMPEKVIPLNAATRIGGVTAEDYGFAVLEYGDGASFVKTCATEVNGFERRQLVVCAEKATYELKPLEKHYVLPGVPSSMLYTAASVTTAEMETNPWFDHSEKVYSESFDRYDGMMSEFYDIVMRKKANPYSLEYEELLFKTILRACGM